MKTVIKLSENCAVELLHSIPDMQERKLLKQERKWRKEQKKKVNAFLKKEYNRFKVLKAFKLQKYVKCHDCGKNAPIFSNGKVTRCLDCRKKARAKTNHEQYLRQVKLGWRHY